jgi:hypothetical protein
VSDTGKQPAARSARKGLESIVSAGAELDQRAYRCVVATGGLRSSNSPTEGTSRDSVQRKRQRPGILVSKEYSANGAAQIFDKARPFSRIFMRFKFESSLQGRLEPVLHGMTARAT